MVKSKDIRLRIDLMVSNDGLDSSVYAVGMDSHLWTSMASSPLALTHARVPTGLPLVWRCDVTELMQLNETTEHHMLLVFLKKTLSAIKPDDKTQLLIGYVFLENEDLVKMLSERQLRVPLRGASRLELNDTSVLLALEGGVERPQLSPISQHAAEAPSSKLLEVLSIELYGSYLAGLASKTSTKASSRKVFVEVSLKSKSQTSRTSEVLLQESIVWQTPFTLDLTSAEECLSLTVFRRHSDRSKSILGSVEQKLSEWVTQSGAPRSLQRTETMLSMTCRIVSSAAIPKSTCGKSAHSNTKQRGKIDEGLYRSLEILRLFFGEQLLSACPAELDLEKTMVNSSSIAAALPSVDSAVPTDVVEIWASPSKPRPICAAEIYTEFVAHARKRNSAGEVPTELNNDSRLHRSRIQSLRPVTDT